MLDLHGTRLTLHPHPDGTIRLALHCLKRDHPLGHVQLTPTQLGAVAQALHRRVPQQVQGACGGTLSVYAWPGLCLHPAGAPGGIALSTAGAEHALWKLLSRTAQLELVAS